MPDERKEIKSTTELDKFLSVDAVPEGKEIVFTIKKAWKEEVTHDGMHKKEMLTLDVEESHLILVVNNTSKKTLAKAWGTKLDSWIGKKIAVSKGNIKGKAAKIIRPFTGGQAK